MISRYIVVASRFAVPFFFVITGFFLQSIIDKGKFNGYVKKIINLTVGANILYLILEYSCGTLNVTSVQDILLQMLGVPVWGRITWYLFCLIYSCLIVKFIYINLKYGDNKTITVSFHRIFLDNPIFSVIAS